METQTTTTTQEPEHQDRTSLWLAIFVGPLTWSVDFALTYALTGRACTVQSASLLLVFSVVAFAATLAGLVTAVRATRALAPPGDAGWTRGDPTRFMAVAGIAVSGSFLLVILAAAIPRLMVRPCV